MSPEVPSRLHLWSLCEPQETLEALMNYHPLAPSGVKPQHWALASFTFHCVDNQRITEHKLGSEGFISLRCSCPSLSLREVKAGTEAETGMLLLPGLLPAHTATFARVTPPIIYRTLPNRSLIRQYPIGLPTGQSYGDIFLLGPPS